jgi:tRNA pseudouridine38-40 synthase
VSVIRLLVAYDGTDFAGFQAQPNQRTVQGSIEDALAQIASHPVRIKAAGRTDAGVHALGQVVSLSDETLDAEIVMRAMPSLLPKDVSVIDAQSGPDDFESRRSAKSRSYVYLLWNHEAVNPIYRKYSLWTRESLDVRKMNEAFREIVGTHDFTSFGRVREEQTPERTILSATVVADAPFVRIAVTGVSFLHQMVRSLVGTALEIGTGKRPASFMRDALEACDRAAAGQVAPPHGLTLTSVTYDNITWPRGVPLQWPWSDHCLPDPVRSCA